MRQVTVTVPDDTHLLELIDRLDAELGPPSAADIGWARRVTDPDEAPDAGDLIRPDSR